MNEDVLTVTGDNAPDEELPNREYAKALGARLRAIRAQQHLSLLNLERLQSIPAEDAGALVRFAAAIQRQRGDYGNKVLSIRNEDLRSLAIIYDTSVEGLTEKLVRWQVLAPDSLILDGEP
jgi:hypothetical protein